MLFKQQGPLLVRRRDATAPSSAKIRAKTVLLSASTGNQDITISGFGTPKAAIFLWAPVTTLDTPSANNTGCIGFTDGSASICSGWHDPAGTDGDFRILQNDSVLAQVSNQSATPTYTRRATFVSWITDGIRINNVSASTATYVTVILIGTDASLSVDVGYDTMPNNSISKNVSIGFKPRLLLSIAALDKTFNNSSATAGIVGGVNFAAAALNVNGTSAGSSQMRSARVGSDTQGLLVDSQPVASSGFYATLAHYDAGAGNEADDGFTVQNLAGSSVIDGDGFGWLAIGGSDAEILAAVVSETIPTTASTPSARNFTGGSGTPAWTPKAVLNLGTYLTALNTYNDTGQGSGAAIGIVTASEQSCHSWATKDGATTTDKRANVVQKPLDNYSTQLSDRYQSNFTSLVPGGWTGELTDAPATTARYMSRIMIG